MTTEDETPLPATETIRDRTHGTPILSHRYWDHIARVLFARRQYEHYGLPAEAV